MIRTPTCLDIELKANAGVEARRDPSRALVVDLDASGDARSGLTSIVPHATLDLPKVETVALRRITAGRTSPSSAHCRRPVGSVLKHEYMGRTVGTVWRWAMMPSDHMLRCVA